MNVSIRRHAGLALALVSATALAACAPRTNIADAPIDVRGTDPGLGRTATAPQAAAPQANAPATAPGGIVSYDGYEAVVAGQGDTVQSLADRVGLSASELGAYNGLSPRQPLRAGDELVLPPRPGGYGGMSVASAATPGGGVAPLPSSEIEAAPIGGSEVAPIAAGTAAPTSPTETASGWSPDVAAAAIDRAGSSDAPLTPPPSAGTPLPPEPERAPTLDSPNLGQYQTPAPVMRPPANTEVREEAAAEVDAAAQQQLAIADGQSRDPGLSSLRLTRPVDGPVAVAYNTWSEGGTRNEGVDFSAPAGTPVAAAADGTVALVSPSLGGLGTIVVLRHADEILTVYGRVDKVTVAKGAPVRRGQSIGVVATPPADAGEPRMHFEVRRGAQSVDPMPFF